MDEWTERGRKRLIERFCVAHPNFSVKNLPRARFVRSTCNNLAAITLRVWFMRRTLCWILSRWSLPPGVLVVTVPSSSSKVCARAHHVIMYPRYPNPQGHQRLSPASPSRRFRLAALSQSNNPFASSLNLYISGTCTHHL